MDKKNKWHKYFFSISKINSEQSTCLRRKVGAVIVRDEAIISTGYNGSPRNVQHCSERGCLRIKLNIPSGERHEICYGAHAEANAIAIAAKNGVIVQGAVMYCTTYPCSQCAKLIINSGIEKVYYIDGYPDELTNIMFTEANIECERYNDGEKSDN